MPRGLISPRRRAVLSHSRPKPPPVGPEVAWPQGLAYKQPGDPQRWLRTAALPLKRYSHSMWANIQQASPSGVCVRWWHL